MRLAAVFAQAVQHRRQRHARRGGQCQRGQRVGGVVAAPDAQRVGRHQPLQRGLDRRRHRAPAHLDRRVIRRLRAHQPRHAALHHQPPVAHAARNVQPETHHVRRRLLRCHRFDQRVVGVDHPHGVRPEDARLGLGVGGHRAVPVEVVLRHVEHGGGGRVETSDAVELEAGEFEHPDLGQRVGTGLQRRGQRVHQRRADVAGHRHAQPGALGELRGQRGGGGLAVGASDGDDLGRVALRGLQVLQRQREQQQLALHRRAACARRVQQRRDRRIQRRQARALEHQRHAVQQRQRERPAVELGLRHFAGQRRLLRRRLARVGDHDARRATALRPARHRESRVTQTQDQQRQVLQCIHLRFRAPEQLSAASGWTGPRGTAAS